MSATVLPVLYALFVWWFSTGVIVYLDGLPPRTFGWSLAGATAVAALGLYGLAVSRHDQSVAGVYCAFTCALLVWAWHEMSFLMGVVTGPRREALPEGCTGAARLGYAIQAIAYHEMALALTALLVHAVTAGGANRFGFWTFLVLWMMRISAKLNVFLGVRNLARDFLPAHLQFLASYFRRRPMNWFFPVSVTLSTVIALRMIEMGAMNDRPDFETTGFTFLAALMALAVLEHWFMVLPFEATALWKWSLKSHVATKAAETHGTARPAALLAQTGTAA